MITISHLEKTFGATQALRDVSLEVRDREFFGLLGPNGAGKSTLLNILVGYLKPEKGTVTIGTVDAIARPLDARRLIGFVPQEIALYGRLNPLDNLQLFGALQGLNGKQITTRSEELLNAVGLWDRRKDKVSTFSGGMKRRLNIIASLMHAPPLILCDEPTVGVDPQSRNAIFDFLKSLHEAGSTMVYTTHYMEEAERLCTRIAVVDHGQMIASGSLDELLKLAPERPSIRVALAQSTELDLTPFASFGDVQMHEHVLTVTPKATDVKLSSLLGLLEERGISYSDVRFDRPTLESVFLHLTGRSLRE
jgi:ABC-2 type transport system ATP-binding protein